MDGRFEGLNNEYRIVYNVSITFVWLGGITLENVLSNTIILLGQLSRRQSIFKKFTCANFLRQAAVSFILAEVIFFLSKLF